MNALAVLDISCFDNVALMAFIGSGCNNHVNKLDLLNNVYCY